MSLDKGQSTDSSHIQPVAGITGRLQTQSTLQGPKPPPTEMQRAGSSLYELSFQCILSNLS